MPAKISIPRRRQGGLACGALAALAFMQAQPGHALETGKPQSAKGQWLYVDTGPGSAKLGWGDPAEEHFDGIRMECSSKKKSVLMVVDVDPKGAKRAKATVSRGTVNLVVQGPVEEGPDSSSITGNISFNEFNAFGFQAGDIVISSPNGSASYSPQKLESYLPKFIKACGITATSQPQPVAAAVPTPSPEAPASIFVKACTKDGSGNAKQCSCAEEIFRRKFGPRGFATIELAVQGKMDAAKAAFQRMSTQEQFNYGAGISLAGNSTNAACGTRIRM